MSAPELSDVTPMRTAGAAMMVAPTEFRRTHPSRGRVLIGEDDREQALALRSILVDEDYDVALATDGAQVVRLAQKLRPDLILLDVHMPVLDGFDALEELVGDARTRDLPILIVSGADDLLPRVRELKLDTVDFLRKPFSLMELLARVDRSLNQAASREHLRNEASIDDLTGLGNPRYLRERLSLEQSRIARYGTHSAIVMVDVDKLKQINDRHGHVVGSRILRAIGQTLRREIRDTDLAARYGGDEFVVLLPHTTAPEALRVRRARARPPRAACAPRGSTSRSAWASPRSRGRAGSRSTSCSPRPTPPPTAPSARAATGSASSTRRSTWCVPARADQGRRRSTRRVARSVQSESIGQRDADR